MPLHPDTIQAIGRAREAAARGNRIVFVSGTFNIVHPGHLRLLRFASECGDYLVVGVLGERLASNAHLGEEMRLEGVSAINWVSQAFVLHDPPEQMIVELKPHMVVKGKEHESRPNPELEAVNAYGGRLLFGSGDTIFSSLDLIHRETEHINHLAIARPNAYLRRHGLDLQKAAQALERFAERKVCVIGDTIVDEYVQCDPLGMSQEDPTIVVAPVMTERFVGGAAIVAAHARSLGARSVDFVSVIGEDPVGAYVKDKLTEYGVNAMLIGDDSRPTTLKQRYRAASKTLLRVSHLRQHRIGKEIQERALAHVMESLSSAELVIFSDFNYGALPQQLVDAITEECRRKEVMIFADSQSSSQVGDVSRFKGAMLLTPTEREARLALGNFEDGLVVVAEKLRQRAEAQNIAITLGAEGLMVHAKLKEHDDWLTDRLEALNSAPKDQAGAGDCLLVCAALAMRSGSSIWESLYLGSLAAACQVGRIGNVPLSAAEMRVELGKNGSPRA